MAKTLLSAFVLATLAQTGLAATPIQEFNWDQKTYMPLDPAGSKGSQSLALGFGSVMGREAREPIMRLHLTKGMPVPVDFGMILGTSSDNLTQQAGCHLQWTVFEGFRLPALSLRAAMMRTFKPRVHEEDQNPTVANGSGTHQDTQSAEMVVSWGLLGILTPYAGAGPVIMEEGTSFQKLAGIEIQVLPPFTRLSIEGRNAFGTNTVAAKVSLGL